MTKSISPLPLKKLREFQSILFGNTESIMEIICYSNYYEIKYNLYHRGI